MKILLVDDSKTTAKLLTDIIKDLPDCEVVGVATNGAEGLKLYDELEPDVICMDVVMPIMDGLQTTRAILQRNAEAKIVVISSVGGVGDKAVEALKLGAKSVISKPFQADEIRQTLASL